MYRRNTEIFKSPIHLVRPLTVDPTRRFERDDTIDDEQRPKTGGPETRKKRVSDFQSNSTSTNFSFASDEEYDTDLEDDSDPYRDRSCIGMYERVCQQQHIVPVGRYLKLYKEEEFSLHYYGLGPKRMRSFVPSLTMNQHITTLDLASNGLGDEGVVYLAHILRDNIAISDINLSQNFIGLDGTRSLCEMFKDNITINHLRLQGNLLTDECALLFAELISGCGQLYTLDLAKNKFGPESGVFLGQALAENTTMQSLDLSWNSIGGKGAVALIKGLQVSISDKGALFCCSSKRLIDVTNLPFYFIGLAGAECGRACFQALKENTTLVELDLSHNRLTTEPATYIGRGLAKSESLQTIHLTGNPLESSGCYAILKPLVAKNITPNKLELIDITEIMVNRDFHELYIQVTEQRPGLRILVGLKAPPTLLKEGSRVLTAPIERFRTLIQRRPQLDLTKFFFSIASGGEELSDKRITDHALLKQATREKLDVQFSDADIDEILKEIAIFDCKKFTLSFDNKPITHSLSSSSWRFTS